jgi:murein DD-endopeptidase MepM/ murein hydrolase activator NlpD
MPKKNKENNISKTVNTKSTEKKKTKFIKYVEFNVNYPALEKAMKIDVETEGKISWIDILSFLGAKYGGKFQNRYSEKDINNLVSNLKSGKSLEELTKNMKLFSYYREAYGAVLGGFLGKYKAQTSKKEKDKTKFIEKYGLKVFLPIAKTFPFNHYKDFGSSRSYGFSRPHLGHDLMAATGTPVIAIESGYVECKGWNQYGGWRIGIRSFDKKRYYYYAHLRKNRPYHVNIEKGKAIKAGDVIGYVGRTGYSRNEDVNNINTSHLHVGLQLVFDESQKECNNEIWVDLYSITQLLEKNRSAVIRENETKEYYRQLDFSEESYEDFIKNQNNF